jgi:hypothetical protein
LQAGNAIAIPEKLMKQTVLTGIFLQPHIPRNKNEKVLASSPAMSLFDYHIMLTASSELY